MDIFGDFGDDGGHDGNMHHDDATGHDAHDHHFSDPFHSDPHDPLHSDSHYTSPLPDPYEHPLPSGHDYVAPLPDATSGHTHFEPHEIPHIEPHGHIPPVHPPHIDMPKIVKDTAGAINKVHHVAHKVGEAIEHGLEVTEHLDTKKIEKAAEGIWAKFAKMHWGKKTAIVGGTAALGSTVGYWVFKTQQDKDKQQQPEGAQL